MEALIGTIIGAVIALIGTWITTKHSTQAQMKTAILSTILPARLDAYRRFEAALAEWGGSTSAESYAAVYQAGNMALLVSSAKTATHLVKVCNALRKCELTGLPDLKQFDLFHSDLILEMNRDLMNIQVPKIEKNKE